MIRSILIFTFVLDSTDSKHTNLLDTILRDNIIADQKTRDSEFRENCKLKWETDNCLKSLKGWNVVQANDNCIILKKTVTEILRLQNYWSILIKFFVCFYILICQYLLVCISWIIENKISLNLFTLMILYISYAIQSVVANVHWMLDNSEFDRKLR